jgi:hypothetical protein
MTGLPPSDEGEAPLAFAEDGRCHMMYLKSRLVWFAGAAALLLPKPALPAPTPPPTIYRVITTAFCSRLHETVRPAVAMILENDQKIAQSPALFKQYGRGVLGAQDPAAGNFSNGAPPVNDSINVSSPETRMALQRMFYLVSPIAQNIIHAQKMLTDRALLAPTGNADDDRRLAQIKEQLMKTIAYQSASLDLINGFVTTQQMGELQHAGEEYIGSISGNEEANPPMRETPDPYMQDPNAPGLPQNPYVVDLSTVPGLIVGYNPLARITGGMEWLRGQTQKHEDAAAASITSAIAECKTLHQEP